MSEKNEDFPNGFQAFLLVVALVLVECMIGRVLYQWRGEGSAGWSQDLIALDMLLANGCVFTFVMHFKGLSYADLFHASVSAARPKFILLLPAVLMTVPCLVLATSAVVNLVAQAFPMSPSEEMMFERMASTSPSSLILVCLLAPVLEEMLFRGVILRSFLHQYARGPAILGSAVLFGFAHLNLYQFIAGLVTGLFSGWLYERTRSLIPCVLLHMAYNSALVLPPLFNAGDPYSDPVGLPPAFWFTAFVACALGVQWLRSLLREPLVRQR